MINKNQISAYCLLAHVNDNDRGIHDLAQIFIPLVKKSIASFMSAGKQAGKANDIKKEFDQLFGLDIPYGLIQRLLRQIAQELNKPELSPVITVHNDGSFIISEFEFTEIDEILNQQNADIELIENSYEIFINNSGLEKDNEPSLFEFLDCHHQELAGFFSARSNFDTSVEFTTPALFVESVKNEEIKFGILRRIYLGSLISSYLQMPSNVPTESSKELLFDTSFIISLLDLSSEESFHTCKMVVDIANKIGWKITVLDITISETKSLIERCSEYIETKSLPQFLSPTSIEAGCARRKLTKTDLLRIASSLKKSLKKHNIVFHNVTPRMESKARSTALYKKITSRTRNPDGAHHDAVATYYVASKRGGPSRSLLDTDCWFVSSHDPHIDNGLLIRDDGSYFETIRAEYLLNVMWLASPAARILEVPTLGLSKMVASTIERSLPSHLVLREFDINLRKFGPDELTVDDVALVANSTAVKSAKRLEKLNVLAQSDREQFCHDVLSIADEEREKIRNLEVSIAREKELRSKLEIQRKEAEDQAKKSEDNFKKANSKLHEIKLSEIKKLNETISNNKIVYEKAKYKSRKIIQLLRWLVVILIMALSYLSWKIINMFEWQTLEPSVSIISLFTPLLLFSICYAIWGESLKTVLKRIEDSSYAWMLNRSDVSENTIQELNEKLYNLQDELSILSVELES